MQFCISLKIKVDIHLRISRWKSFRQHWSCVIYMIWVSKGTNLLGIIKDQGQLILEKDWIELWQTGSGKKSFQLVLLPTGSAMHLTMFQSFSRQV